MNRIMKRKRHSGCPSLCSRLISSPGGRMRAVLPLLAGLFLLSSCAGLNLRPDPQSDVRQAAENYWNARVAADWVTCYKYEEVSKLQKESLSQYVNRQGNLIYKSARVTGIEMKGPDEAMVQVALEYYLPAFGTNHAFKTVLKNKWVRLGGKWYHHVEKRLMQGNDKKEGGG